MEEITSSGISPTVFWIVGGIVVCIVLIIIVVAVKKMFRRTELYGMSKEEIKKKWQLIEEMAQRNDEMSHKLALMEADKLLDHVLKALGFGGTTLAERLKLAAYRYPKIRNVWPAHLARNRMVHEASYHLSGSTARDAIRRFRDALHEFGVL
ncbi:MAG: hypothetical protein AAB400_05100 [Patescibacteria group bacterium]